MNQSLMDYLKDKGYNQVNINERIRAMLVSGTGGDSAAPIEQLWLQLGIANGYGSTVGEVQMNWAASQSGTNSGWNDNFRNLPNSTMNLIGNGSFLVDSLGWVLGTGWSTVLGMALKIAGATADLSFSSLVPTPGETYRVTATYTITAGIFYSRIGGVQSVGHTTTGTYVDDIVATNTTPFAIRGGSTAIGAVTNISVRKL